MSDDRDVRVSVLSAEGRAINMITSFIIMIACWFELFVPPSLTFGRDVIVTWGCWGATRYPQLPGTRVACATSRERASKQSIFDYGEGVVLVRATDRPRSVVLTSVASRGFFCNSG